MIQWTSAPMRIALCNEVLGDVPFERQCALAVALGYDALEVTPFTLGDDIFALTAGEIAAFRRSAESAGIEIAGLHWLLVRPAGLSITTDDRVAYERTVATIERLVDLCAELGGRYLVHGSPAQRRLPQNGAVEAARDRAIDAFARAAERAERAGVTYCIEPLAPPAANFITSVEEAVRVVRSVGSPALKTMVDTHAAALAESLPIDALLDRWLPTGLIAHIQLNDPNRRGPGQGELGFAAIVAALVRHRYAGYVAIEPFDHFPDGATCAARAIGYVRGLLENQR